MEKQFSFYLPDPAQWELPFWRPVEWEVVSRRRRGGRVFVVRRPVRRYA